MKLNGSLKERLSGDGKELSGIRGPVLIQDRWPSLLGFPYQFGIISPKDTGPGAIHAPLWQYGSTIGGSILLIQLMSKFMEHHILSLIHI